MSKETSAEVASKAAKLNTLTPEDIGKMDAAQLDEVCGDVRSVAVSAMVQREPDQAAILEDPDAFGKFIFDNLKLVVVPTQRSAFELGQKIIGHLKGQE